MSISELLLQYDDDGPFVEVKTGEASYERRPVTLGLSDGITAEVLSGVEMTDEIKVWNQPIYD